MDLVTSKLWCIEFTTDRTMWVEANTIEDAIRISRRKYGNDNIVKVSSGPVFYKEIIERPF